MSIKRENVLIIAVAVIAVVAFFGGFSLYEKRQHLSYEADRTNELITTSTTTSYNRAGNNISQLSASPNSELVLNVYNNNDYNYQIIYPAEMQGEYLHETARAYEDQYYVYLKDKNAQEIFIVEATKRDIELSLEQKIKKDTQNFGEDLYIDDSTYVNVNDYYGIQRSEIRNGLFTRLVTYVKIEGVFYRLILYTYGEITPELKQRYDSIVGTFKVLR